MGTETDELGLTPYKARVALVKFNNPLMGTETFCPLG